MGADTLIEWADHTFNPWIGCTAVSPACDNCYAEALATARLGVQWGPHAERRRTAESAWRQPLAWNRKAQREGRRYRVFCASLADVFDKAVPIEWFVDTLDLVRITPHLIWLLLTKRPQLIDGRLTDAMLHAEAHAMPALDEWLTEWLNGAPPPNVWLGTTVENQAEADRRIPHLLAVPAAKHFLSCEPLLGPVDLSIAWHGASSLDAECWGDCKWCENGHPPLHNCQRGRQSEDVFMRGLGIDWVIAGGESGPKARPSHPDWFRSLRDQCQAAGVPFFFKQWGEWAPGEACGGPATRTEDVAWWRDDRWDTDRMTPGDSAGLHIDDEPDVWRAGKRKTGATLDGREWREVPA